MQPLMQLLLSKPIWERNLKLLCIFFSIPCHNTVEHFYHMCLLTIWTFLLTVTDFLFHCSFTVLWQWTEIILHSYADLSFMRISEKRQINKADTCTTVHSILPTIVRTVETGKKWRGTILFWILVHCLHVSWQLIECSYHFFILQQYF